MAPTADIRRRARGITLVETLVAVLITTIAISGSVSLFFATLNMTNRTSYESVAQALVQRRLEEAKGTGFAGATVGTAVLYCDRSGDVCSTTKKASDVFSVTTVVTATLEVGLPPERALKTIVVTVRRLSDNAVMEASGTYLTWGGL